MNRLSPATVVAWIFVHAFSVDKCARQLVSLCPERAPHRPMHWTILGSGARPAARSRHSSLHSIASRDHFCRRRGMRQSLWRRAWRRLLVCTVEGGCFLNRERKDVWSYAILGERLCAPRMFLVVSADQGNIIHPTYLDSSDALRSPYDLIPDPDARVATLRFRTHPVRSRTDRMIVLL